MITLNRIGRSLLLFTSIMLIASTTEAYEKEHAPLPASTRFPCRLGNETIYLEMALNLNEMRLGLMFRNNLPKDNGMLFCYEYPRKLSFWMRNTLIPLDIGYFDSTGTLVEIYHMKARDETSVTSKSDALQFALEMNKGWFEEHNIQPGAKLEMATVLSAIMARGYDPSDYNL